MGGLTTQEHLVALAHSIYRARVWVPELSVSAEVRQLVQKYKTEICLSEASLYPFRAINTGAAEHVVVYKIHIIPSIYIACSLYRRWISLSAQKWGKVS